MSGKTAKEIAKLYRNTVPVAQTQPHYIKEALLAL